MSGDALGKYSLLREVGRGAMGVVYEAVDRELGRRVALKVLLTNVSWDPEEAAQDQERFLREARLSAALPKHPNIVGIYEAGTIDQKRYIAMEFVEGCQMSAWWKKSSPTVRQQVALLREVALAVHHAHLHGVIHRDLKPENVLIDQDQRPHVMDFGLGKRSKESAKSLALTAEGLVVGTPVYMSPEQAEGRKSIDGRTDVYALGAMLYQILTGRLPFQGPSAMSILVKVMHEPPARPSQVAGVKTAPAIDPGIEAVCLKALAKKPSDRYHSARALAADLSRWLSGQKPNVTLRRQRVPGPLPWLAGLAAGMLGLACLGLALSRGDSVQEPTVDYSTPEGQLARGRIEDALRSFESILRAHPGDRRAEAGRRKARSIEVDRLLAEAGKKLSAGEFPAALILYGKVLDRDPQNSGAIEGQNTAARRIDEAKRLAVLEAEQKARKDLRGEDPKAALAAARPAPDPAPVAVIPRPALPSRPPSLEGRFMLKGHSGEGRAVAFSPDGKTVASGGYDGRICLWDVTTGQEQPRSFHQGMPLWSLAYSPDGRTLAAADMGHKVKLWDLRSGTERLSFSGHTLQVVQCVFSPDGVLVASASPDASVRVWEAATGRERAVLRDHPMGALCVAFSPDGKTLAAGTAGRQIRLWDWERGSFRISLEGHTEGVWSLAFSSDGKTLVSGSSDGQIKIWDWLLGKERASLQAEKEKWARATLSPDGKYIVSLGEQGGLTLWDALSGQSISVQRGHVGHGGAVAISPQGNFVATAGFPECVRIWELSVEGAQKP